MKSVDIEMWIHDNVEDPSHVDVELEQNFVVHDEAPIARQVGMFVNFLRAQTYTDGLISQFINMEAVENGDWEG